MKWYCDSGFEAYKQLYTFIRRIKKGSKTTEN